MLLCDVSDVGVRCYQDDTLDENVLFDHKPGWYWNYWVQWMTMIIISTVKKLIRILDAWIL